MTHMSPENRTWDAAPRPLIRRNNRVTSNRSISIGNKAAAENSNSWFRSTSHTGLEHVEGVGETRGCRAQGGGGGGGGSKIMIHSLSLFVLKCNKKHTS